MSVRPQKVRFTQETKKRVALIHSMRMWAKHEHARVSTGRPMAGDARSPIASGPGLFFSGGCAGADCGFYMCEPSILRVTPLAFHVALSKRKRRERRGSQRPPQPAHTPRAAVLSFAVTLFPVGLKWNKTNRGLLTPTRSQPRLGSVVWCGGSAQLRKKMCLAPRPLLSASPHACSEVPGRRGSRGLFAL